MDKGAACKEAPQADCRQAGEGEAQGELAGPEDVLREEFAPLFDWRFNLEKIRPLLFTSPHGSWDATSLAGGRSLRPARGRGELPTSPPVMVSAEGFHLIFSPLFGCSCSQLTG